MKIKFALENYKKRDLNGLINAIESDLLFTLQYNDQNKKSAINDIFKGLTISDSTFINPDQLVLLKKLDLSTFDKNNNIIPSLYILL